MISFIIAAVFLLVPISLGLNYLQRIGDLKHKSYEASRYALWERTVWSESASTGYAEKTTESINREISKRIYAQGARPLDSKSDKLASSPSLAANELDRNLYAWGGVGARSPIIINNTDGELNSLVISNSRAPGSFSNDINAVADAMFDLSRNGFYKAEVTVDVFKDPRYSDEWIKVLPNGIGLLVNTHNAMLVGAWNASSDRQGSAQVSPRVKRTMLTDDINTPVFQTLQTGIAFFAPEIGRLDLGRVEPEQIPCQRLSQSDGSCN
jgi:hypothetical protein